MKRTLLISCLLISCTLITAQHFHPDQSVEQLSPAFKLNNPGADLALEVNPGVPVAPRMFEEEIGNTGFALQTLGCLGRRIDWNADGTLSAIWLYGEEDPWPGRGTAYNHFDGSAWGTPTNARVEITRSGYPSFTRLPDGTDVILSHKNTSDTQWFLQALTKAPGATEWTEYEIPSTVTGGPVWSKVATGGPDGNTLHVVAVSVATDFGGVIYEGMNQHPLYYRSPDGGATWDKVDFIIPEMDSTGWLSVGGESYNIDARGETVAITIFDSWGDIALFKSEDNGDNWTKTIVRDFPLDKYDGTGYTANDIPQDTSAPSELAILSCDGSGSVILDNNGNAHVFFSWMYVEDGDGLYLGTSGIAYWNEGMATDEVVTIADIEDLDGDGLINIVGVLNDYRYFNSGLTAYPMASVDDDNNLYLVYMAVQESLISGENQNYRHIYLIKSTDGGATWSDPFDVINPETNEFWEFTEAAYPAIPNRTGNSIHFIYMQDYSPGNITGGDHSIMYINLDKEDFGLFTSAEEIENLDDEIQIYPNPVSDIFWLEFELKNTSEVKINVFNMLGENVQHLKKEKLPAGKQNLTINTANYAAGIYQVQLLINGRQVTRKIIVQ